MKEERVYSIHDTFQNVLAFDSIPRPNSRARCNHVAQSKSCPSLLVSFANSSPLVQPTPSVPFSRAAADVHGWTSGSRPFAAIPETAFPGTHRKTSSRPASSTTVPNLTGSAQFDKLDVPLCLLLPLPARILSILRSTNAARRG